MFALPADQKKTAGDGCPTGTSSCLLFSKQCPMPGECPQHHEDSQYSSSPLRDCVVLSLRGSKTTEAISQGFENNQIASPACRNAALRRAGTLPSVARNDKTRIVTQSLRGEDRGGGANGTFPLPPSPARGEGE